MDQPISERHQKFTDVPFVNLISCTLARVHDVDVNVKTCSALSATILAGTTAIFDKTDRRTAHNLMSAILFPTRVPIAVAFRKGKMPPGADWSVIASLENSYLRGDHRNDRIGTRVRRIK